MMKNIVFSLALLGALTETGLAFAESKSLPDCAVTSAKSHGVELALFRALMIHELGETPLAAPCSFYEAAAANLATSLNSQHGDRWGAVSLFIHGRVLLDDPAVERVRTIYESK
ncbi:hypothetical protein O8J74_23935 [Pseudomonas aeruginosa]|uniref:hypothetical protein n=1 Tax=Pseudomonas aeruginosa TaxID=287 RepID=UPI0022B5FBDA|nr:hypothetical protein [Pseudomonas aeruginosa]MCZ7830976.1 hypothetical protein [Pseudomonas aeruginosa]MCZ7871054.1 hypothetical protein [Pseudomonas aeruginosa]